MTWDRYELPNMPRERPDHRLTQQPPVRGSVVAAVLGAMALMALVLSVAAHAQDTSESSTGTAEQQAQQEQQAQEEQAQQEQSGATSATQAESEAQPAEQQATAALLKGQIVEQPEGTYAASKLIGRSVMSAEGEEIGQISDLLVTEDNRVRAVMIGVGGFLGFGEKKIAVELDRLTRAPAPGGGAEQLVLNFTRAELEQAPEFVSLEQQRQQ